MSKKLGLTFLFIGAYLTLIGGLVWVMHFTATAELSQLCKPYDWVWGFAIGVILVLGTVMAIKGYIFGIIGLVIVAVGICLDIALLIFGITKEDFLSPLVLSGTISSIVGFVFTTIAHIRKMVHISKFGNSMLK